MEDLSFQAHFPHFAGLGFVSKDEKTEEFKNLFAVFFYVHHGQFLSEVNKKLAERKMRPATKKELRDFYNFQRLTLENHDNIFFISTSTDDVQPNAKRKEMSLVAGIWKDEQNKLFFGNVTLDKLAGDEEHIPGHQMFVVAIDVQKSQG